MTTQIQDSPAIATPNPEASLNTFGNISADTTIDDLIPPELREAVKKAEAIAPPKEETKVDDKVVKSDDTVVLDDQKEIPEDDEDVEVDLSSENIDKLIKGDPDAIKSKTKEADESKVPVWHEQEEYKAVAKKLSNMGVPAAEIDIVIKAAVDAHVIESGKYTTGLETEVETRKNKETLLISEIERLKKIERAAHFDSLEETEKNYNKPKREVASSLKRLLELEGAEVSPSQLLAAKDKTELTALLKDISFDEATLSEVTNLWKNYKDLEFKYLTDKNDAEKDLGKHLSSHIPEETSRKILNTAFNAFIKSDPKYKYIADAVFDPKGLKESPEIEQLVGIAKLNFNNLVKAISNPTDYARNNEFLSGLAKFVFNASHAIHIEKQHVAMQKEYMDQSADLRKLALAYKGLLSSAKGHSNSRSNAAASHGNTNGAVKDTEAVDIANLLLGRADVGEFIPGFK